MSQLFAEIATAIWFYTTMARFNVRWAYERLRARKGD